LALARNQGRARPLKSRQAEGWELVPIAIVVVFKGIPGEDGVKVIPLSGHISGNQPLAEMASAAQSILERFAASQERKEKDRKEKRSSRETAVLVE